MTRQEKERLYIRKMKELQRIWKNPIEDSDFDDVEDYTDEQLNKGIEDTIGQIRFEKFFVFFGWIFKIVATIFILFGIIGLLLFGVRQLF